MPGEAVAIVKTVAVWGVQGIGAGVAQMAALGGWRVLLCDSDAGAAERCKKTIVDRLAHAVQQDGLTEEDRSAALDRIRASHGFSDLADVDVAIELAVEDLATKQSILERLEAVIRKDAVLATHSSLHSVEHIAATLRDSSRVVGIHFHSPAHKIPVVEVVAAESTRASSVVAAVDGTREIAMPVTFSVLTNIVAFAPLFFVSGIMGKVFRQIPVVVVAVFAISLIESLLILPAHIGHRKPRPETGLFGWVLRQQQRFSDRFSHLVRTRYGPLLDLVLRHRYVAVSIGAVVLMLTLSYVKSGRMGFELFPKIESDYALVTAVLPYGTAVQKTEAVQRTLV